MWRVNRYPAKEKKNWSDINQMKKKPPPHLPDRVIHTSNK